MNKIQLKTRSSMEIISVDDIIHIKADGNYSIISIGDERRRISKKIKYFEEKLNGYDFIRIHNSYLVNVKHIKEIRLGRRMQLQLNNGTFLPISNSYKAQLMERIGEECKKI